MVSPEPESPPAAATGSPYRSDVIRRTEDHVRELLGREPTGHDWWHAERVRANAVTIAADEGADVFVVELAALLHDVEDYKFSGDDRAGPRAALRWLITERVDRDRADHVAHIIGSISFKGAAAEQPSLSVEGKCIQDADRLDAIGAIGIARTFAYGGYVHRPIHDPGIEPVENMTEHAYKANTGTTVNHFYEKLLLLKDRLHTESARRLAESRHRFMVEFLEEFHREWSLAAIGCEERRSVTTGPVSAGCGVEPHPALDL